MCIAIIDVCITMYQMSARERQNVPQVQLSEDEGLLLTVTSECRVYAQ